jgi:RimJ/RimL family protein N-acetyltransferase
MTVAAVSPVADLPDPKITATLKDGRSVVIRRIVAADTPALIEAIEHADAADLRRRFMGMPPPMAVLVHRVAEADGVHDYALGAFDGAGHLIGVAQFDRTDEMPSAELGIEVATGWQRCGLGRRMLGEIADIACAIGIQRFTATYYADNIAVRRLLHSSGRLIASGVNQGEGYAVLEVVCH